MSDLPEEAVQAAAERLYRDYDSEYGADHLSWRDFADQARKLLEAAAPVIAAQVRRETVEQLATAIVGTPKPPEAYWRAWAARIAREIGEARPERTDHADRD